MHLTFDFFLIFNIIDCMVLICIINFFLCIYYRYDQGPPETVTPLGRFKWTVQDDLIVQVEIEHIPYFNAPIYTENKQQIGKIDEIFGNIRNYFVSIKLSENIKASSFEKDTQV